MLSFTLSGKHMTYTETHALILNHNKHLTVTDIIIFMHSYNTFTYIIILVTNLCLFRYLVCGTELILITNLYLLGSYTYGRLILIQILYLFRFLVCCTELIQYFYLSQLILISISRRSYRTYAYTEVLKQVLVLISISDLP